MGGDGLVAGGGGCVAVIDRGRQVGSVVGREQVEQRVVLRLVEVGRAQVDVPVPGGLEDRVVVGVARTRVDAAGSRGRRGRR